MTDGDLKVSVVICTLRRPAELQRCVIALCAQRRLPLEIVIVDAGDLGRKAVDRLRAECEAANVGLIYLQDDPSTTRQRNLGAGHAGGDVLFFLDDDAELDPGYIETIVGRYEADEGGTLGGVTGVLEPGPPPSRGFWRWYSRFFLLAETRRDVGPRLKRTHWPIHTTGLTQDRECEIMPTTAVSYLATAFREARFDDSLSGYVMAEDVDLSFRVSRRWRLITTPDAVYRHSKSPTARNTTRETERRRVLFTQYFFRKNLGDSRWRRLCRLWSLLGLGLRYGVRGLLTGNRERLRGYLDGIRAAREEGLFSGQPEHRPSTDGH